ncbi:hypothetical protein SDC9_80691 [bioreactor metagenome]|uniref:Uncharacterized protein n=1 Tax=bioreactor metagenome TaxID=1076179 RepID=A0A644Z0N2_9ZZZZ
MGLDESGHAHSEIDAGNQCRDLELVHSHGGAENKGNQRRGSEQGQNVLGAREDHDGKRGPVEQSIDYFLCHW